uniref:Phenylalanine ammonia-lyase n=1 Tax=Cochliobolus lunatus TaxID=5503 RepID=CLZ10_COCLU|nr:RecName: Full=Phenylalanine ammonia-lyase; Short=PAL; AltName: Full=Squalestatin S1 biosynthesis cluster protein clz10; AltName: Full=Zaragozic acid A biosynthesis cluster protein 10 [Curvularia lunata]AXF50644.1 phenyalanine ammonia lyase [Curvularia lunata]AXF50657.1 phenyalanine ammonia lyase [Curvularia lunata]
MSSRPLLTLALSLHDRLDELSNRGQIHLVGYDLDVAAVAAVARHECLPIVNDGEVIARLSESTEILQRSYKGSTTIYGVHTGFGGSADTRPDDSSGLSKGLMQLLQTGVLVVENLDIPGLDTPQDVIPESMPSSWTRATTVVRINQCIRGHSAIRHQTVKSLLKLVAAQITPIVPLRGSISASGDLMPLSYIAGTLEGSPDIYVTKGGGKSAKIISAHDALGEIGMEPLRLGPREGLGLVNGTATSAATASLAVLDAIQLTLLSTGLTCLVSEGMAARVEWLHPFIAETRPHPGQREVAEIMRAFLKGSRLVSGLEGEASTHQHTLNVRPDEGLPQDRYPLRTSPQWLGPQFEDILLAHSQISVELNSTSDNPLTNLKTGAIHHGGNFQATSITSAVEKIRTSLQMVGKLLFSQCTEMINHQMNAGLPPNLAADDPSASFCCKGLDINIAAYQSELSYLSNSISNHVQSAEMHNQAVNSLAFLSTRYTIKAIELLGMMVAGVLYAACQAMDLRVMHATFLETVTATLQKAIADLLPNGFEAEDVERSLASAIRGLRNAWWNNAGSDASERCSLAAVAFVQVLCDPSKHHTDTPKVKVCLDLTAKEMRELQDDVRSHLSQAYHKHHSAFLEKPTTEEYIGEGSKALYLWARQDLGIPMNRGLVDHPSPGSIGKRTIGSYVSMIYQGIQDGRLFQRFATVGREVGLGNGGTNGIRKRAYAEYEIS